MWTPNLNDDINNMEALAEFVSGFSYVEKVEILPFPKREEYQWEQLGYE